MWNNVSLIWESVHYSHIGYKDSSERFKRVDAFWNNVDCYEPDYKLTLAAMPQHSVVNTLFYNTPRSQYAYLRETSNSVLSVTCFVR